MGQSVGNLEEGPIIESSNRPVNVSLREREYTAEEKAHCVRLFVHLYLIKKHVASLDIQIGLVATTIGCFERDREEIVLQSSSSDKMNRGPVRSLLRSMSSSSIIRLCVPKSY